MSEIMNDRELLELAAKAAGIRIVWDAENDAYATANEAGDLFEDWNPLADDGDALRLAVKLGIHITNSDTYAWASTIGTDDTETLGDDPYAATRGCIVRAAAAIGKSMP